MKSYTDLEQSKKLAEILPLESADMCYPLPCEDGDKPLLEQGGFGSTPCWSLAALLSVLPDELEDNHFLTLEKEGNKYCCCYEDINGNSFKHCFSNNPVDTCYEMILKLKEKNLL